MPSLQLFYGFMVCVSNKELCRVDSQHRECCTKSSWSKMEVGRSCGKTTPKSTDADSNNVGSIRRKEDKGKIKVEMGGRTEAHHGPPMVMHRKKQRKMEIEKTEPTNTTTLKTKWKMSEWNFMFKNLTSTVEVLNLCFKPPLKRKCKLTHNESLSNLSPPPRVCPSSKLGAIGLHSFIHSYLPVAFHTPVSL